MAKVIEILLLEDNHDLLDSLLEIINFEKPNYKVTSFMNGSDAWAYINGKNKVDIAILDNMVPGLSGIEICKNIHNDNSLKEIPVIIQSGKMCLTNEEDAKTAGAFAYKTKPYKTSSLIELVEEAYSKTYK